MPPVPPAIEKIATSMAVKLKGLLWEPGARAVFNRLGVDIIPSHFYSPVPSVDEIHSSFEYVDGEYPYADCGFFNDEFMQQFLLALLPYADNFAPEVEGDLDTPSSFFWKNPSFSFSDAMSYYCIIRHLKPRRILEIGSGFSTLVASSALEDNALGEIICIEPHPRPFVRNISRVVRLIEEKVQSIPISYFQNELSDGDILFIDSTHSVKTGSDCLFLYLKVLPALSAKLMMHAHDIFLPEGYPMRWLLEKHIYWTEQYLLQALLTDNPKFQVCYGSNYHRIYHRDLLDRFMQGKATSGGGSFWFQRI